MNIKVNIPIVLNRQCVDDILVTCFEGGSNYWLAEVKFGKLPKESFCLASEVISRGGTLILVDGEEDEEYELDLNKFIKGFRKYVHYCMDRNKPVILDPSMIDGDIADTILQFAIFDSIIYG